MGPLKIHILLEIYSFVRTDDCPYFKRYERRRAVRTSSFVEELVREGLIRPTEPKESGYLPFEVTRKGHVYLNALFKTPMPFQDWVMPNGG